MIIEKFGSSVTSSVNKLVTLTKPCRRIEKDYVIGWLNHFERNNFGYLPKRLCEMENCEVVSLWSNKMMCQK